MSESLVIKGIGGALVALGSYLFGTIDNAVTTLLFFLVADFITGTLVGVRFRNLSARKSRDGFIKKVVTLLMVAVVVQIDVMVGGGGALRILAIYGYIGTEFYSITENAIKLGVPIPEAVGKYFEAYLDKKGTPGRRATDYER